MCEAAAAPSLGPLDLLLDLLVKLDSELEAELLELLYGELATEAFEQRVTRNSDGRHVDTNAVLDASTAT